MDTDKSGALSLEEMLHGCSAMEGPGRAWKCWDLGPLDEITRKKTVTLIHISSLNVLNRGPSVKRHCHPGACVPEAM